MLPIVIQPEKETIANIIAIFQYVSSKVRLKTINRNKGIKMIKCFLLSSTSILRHSFLGIITAAYNHQEKVNSIMQGL